MSQEIDNPNPARQYNPYALALDSKIPSSSVLLVQPIDALGNVIGGGPFTATLLNAITASYTGSAQLVQNYSLHTVQYNTSASKSMVLQLLSSLDNANWYLENAYTPTSANVSCSVVRITGKTKYLECFYATGSGTATALLMSGNA